MAAQPSAVLATSSYLHRYQFYKVTSKGLGIVAISLKHIQTAPISPGKLNSEIPPLIEEVILKAMAKDPAERYQQAQELSIAYWKALQLERARLKSESITSDTNEMPSHNTSDATPPEPAAQLNPPAITRVLEETRQRPPIMPLIVPPTEDNDAVSNKLASTSLPPAQLPKRQSMQRTRRLQLRSRKAIIAIVCMVSSCWPFRSACSRG